MAVLPLYLIAIPFRRSFAAAIWFVEALKGYRERGRYAACAANQPEGDAPSCVPYLERRQRGALYHKSLSRVRSCESTMPTGELLSSTTTRSSMRWLSKRLSTST